MLTSKPGKPNSRITGMSFFQYPRACRRNGPSEPDEMRGKETNVVIDCQPLLKHGQNDCPIGLQAEHACIHQQSFPAYECDIPV
jgi:hypothetical protein